MDVAAQNEGTVKHGRPHDPADSWCWPQPQQRGGRLPDVAVRPGAMAFANSSHGWMLGGSELKGGCRCSATNNGGATWTERANRSVRRSSPAACTVQQPTSDEEARQGRRRTSRADRRTLPRRELDMVRNNPYH